MELSVNEPGKKNMSYPMIGDGPYFSYQQCKWYMTTGGHNNDKAVEESSLPTTAE